MNTHHLIRNLKSSTMRNAIVALSTPNVALNLTYVALRYSND